MHDTSGLPVVLWQLPVGHINSSQAADPSTGSFFPNLTNSNSQGGNSAPTFFFGDTFLPGSNLRQSFFSANRGGGPGAFSVRQRRDLGRTHERGIGGRRHHGFVRSGRRRQHDKHRRTPKDSFWWNTKVQEHLAQPVPLTAR